VSIKPATHSPSLLIFYREAALSVKLNRCAMPSASHPRPRDSFVSMGRGISSLVSAEEDRYPAIQRREGGPMFLEGRWTFFKVEAYSVPDSHYCIAFSTSMALKALHLLISIRPFSRISSFASTRSRPRHGGVRLHSHGEPHPGSPANLRQ